MADSEDHTQPHTTTCARCKQVVTYWGPLGNKSCPRCGLILWARIEPDYRASEGTKLAVTLVVVVAALLLFVFASRG
ncbi:hypothetical protein HXS80_20530 [Streptomyces sp. CB04723]|uniref:hypothetical protein n=1 Tax=Streptomyces TaxID=1883 RepID=UPI0015C44C4A|nr:hypothetical protein [Streptomyces sp. CB04723]QLG33790.1 hypothetical protein HXS80_20530 [Streptomyces sp. CB04723]